MRNFIFLTFFLVSCAGPTPWTKGRDLASLTKAETLSFKLQVSYPLIFANGANAQVLNVQIFDQDGTKLKVNPADLDLHTDVPVLDEKKFPQDDGVQFTFRPIARSPSLKIMVSFKNDFSQVLEIKTTLSPLAEKLIPLKSDASSISYVSGLSYLTHDNFLPHQYEGFSVSNDGKNAIVNQDESARTFDFEFLEQARQNISLMISDAPNGTISHTMHSLFMFFPRLQLPVAEISEDKIVVTLPTAEKMSFAKSGEIIEGVFKEGPVDTGPDRFKRKYADVKYQGSGIVLRANARGQMPQQGQFESTPIDLEYGLKFSNDVLIINGSTGQRCRRPKKDFWSSADVSPIQFKFPSDSEFDQYLRQHCKFGIPQLQEASVMKKKDLSEEVHATWRICEEKADVRRCLQDESKLIEDRFDRQQIVFSLLQKLNLAYLKEKEELPKLIQIEVRRLEYQLESQVSWLKDDNSTRARQDCLSEAKARAKNPLRFQSGERHLQLSLNQMCAGLVLKLQESAIAETQFLRTFLTSDFSWLKDHSAFEAQCLSHSSVLMSSGKRFSHRPDIYQASLKEICAGIPESATYQSWLSSQKDAIENRITAMVLELVEKKADQKALSCLGKFPMDTQINRLAHKKDRESCLINAWEEIEQEALKIASADPMVILVNLSLSGIQEKLVTERRRSQLRVIKKYFLQTKPVS